MKKDTIISKLLRSFGVGFLLTMIFCFAIEGKDGYSLSSYRPEVIMCSISYLLGELMTYGRYKWGE